MFKKLIQKIFKLFYGKISILSDSKILYKKHYIEFIRLDNNTKLSVKKNVHQISNARIYTDTVEHVAIIKNNLIIPKISYQQVHGELKGTEFNKVLTGGTPRIIKKFDGRVLSLVQGASGHNYFHFLFDILAKLILCEEKIPLGKIDYFYIHKKIEWQRKIFQLFDINTDQLISSEKYHHIISDEIIAVDCKISLDDNARSRHEEISKTYDWLQIDKKESEAFHSGLSYIALEGNIGCMVNGAGLAMATMDLIKLCGGFPANFLDVGGGATSETVSNAFKILLSDKNVKVVLVNIFGGIMRCDIIAEGIISAVKDVGVKIPIGTFYFK